MIRLKFVDKWEGGHYAGGISKVNGNLLCRITKNKKISRKIFPNNENQQTTEKIAEKWRPYRTYATLCLWKGLEED